jgi:hypothetical protein
MTAYAFVSYGMGGSSLDPNGGEVVLCQKIKALGVDIGESPYLYSDVNKIAAAIVATPAGSIIILGGDSLGANNAPYIAESIRTKRGVDYLFGFQPSLWGYHSVVPRSVVEALCIYNPNWFETFGFGDYPWPVEAGNTRTKMRYIQNSDAHPGDNDVAMQNVILADIKRITAKPLGVALPGDYTAVANALVTFFTDEIHTLPEFDQGFIPMDKVPAAAGATAKVAVDALDAYRATRNQQT